ncbi:MAG: triose-phosphate isomerase [Panacagrimonas sp.]
MNRRYLVAGNWKMNGSSAQNEALVSGITQGASACSAVEMLICPPSVYLSSVAEQLAGTDIALGGQNLSDQTKAGAFTGEVLGGMLKDCGCSHVIVGHSERRAYYGESDEVVANKLKAAQAQGLHPILCVGETLQARESGDTESVLERQLTAVLDAAGVACFAGATIAYEPVWAIGTGKTASTEQAQAAHAFLRDLIALQDAKIASSLRILYGGSVKPSNAAELFAQKDVDGGLIGGASLKAEDFLAICNAAQAHSA